MWLNCEDFSNQCIAVLEETLVWQFSSMSKTFTEEKWRMSSSRVSKKLRCMYFEKESMCVKFFRKILAPWKYEDCCTLYSGFNRIQLKNRWPKTAKRHFLLNYLLNFPNFQTQFVTWFCGIFDSIKSEAYWTNYKAEHCKHIGLTGFEPAFFISANRMFSQLNYSPIWKSAKFRLYS